MSANKRWLLGRLRSLAYPGASGPTRRFSKLSLGHNWGFTENVCSSWNATVYNVAHPTAAVVLLNILGFWEPFRDLVNIGAREGFIQPQNTSLVKIVDGPEDRVEHEAFDWGKAAIEAIDSWTPPDKQDIYDWTKRKDGAGSGNTIGAI